MTVIKNHQSTAKKQLTSAVLSTYLNQLVQQIKACDKVLACSVLQSEKWNKGCYNLLSDLISTDLLARMSDHELLQTGSSVSAKTLQKIIEGNYVISLPIDPRVINTLNKIVFFLEYKNWEDFVCRANQEEKVVEVSKPAEDEVKDLVQQAIETEFAAYLNLPEIPKNYLIKSFLKGSQAFNKIMEVLLAQQSNHCIVSNQYNPSTFEILNLKVEKLNDNYAQVVTTEFWELCWWDTVNNQYLKRYKNISEHVYIVVKQNNQWKVKTNASSADILKPAHPLPTELSWKQVGNSESQPISTVNLNV